MKKYTRRILAAAVAMTAVTSLAVASGSASAADQSSQPLGSPLIPAETVETPTTQVAIADTSSSEQCGSTTPGSPEWLAGATTTCVKIAPQASTSESTSATTLADTEAATTGGVCSIAQSGYWTWQRFGSCMKDMLVDYTLYSDRGAVLGTGRLNVTTSMTLNFNSSTWNELVTVTLTSTTGQVTSLNVAFDAGCTSPCTMSKPAPWTGAKILTRGQSASGTVTYTDSPATGDWDTFTTKYHMYVTQSGTVPTQPNVNWSNPRSIRCDKAAYGTTSGCVYPHVRANLILPLSQYGAAAATYLWAQQNLPDGWGDKTPLRRFASELGSRLHREQTCGSRSSDPFQPFPDTVVYKDSCDEFPFARTYEGGTNGALCADILPKKVGDQWFVSPANPAKPWTFSEPCARGHVPQPENSAAGGKLGSFPNTDRVLDAEKYNVTITA